MKLTEKELNEFPIGTKIHCREKTIIKADFDACNWRDMENREWYSSNILKTREIDKILFPNYTKYIPPKPILDDKEKEYLSNVIRPFRKRISKIEKVKNPLYKSEWIRFSLICDSIIDESFSLPSFKADTMYKGMELDKEYSLEDLRLIVDENIQM